MVDFPYVKVITRGFISQSQVCTLSPHGVPPAPWNPPWPTWLPWNALDPTRRAHPRRAPPERWGAFFWTGKCWKNGGKWWNMSAKFWKNGGKMIATWWENGEIVGITPPKMLEKKWSTGDQIDHPGRKAKRSWCFHMSRNPPIRQSRGLEGSVEIQ